MQKKSALAQQFGEHVRRLRLERSLSQEELAFRCGRSLNFTSEIETGKRNPSLDTIAAICSGLEVTLAEFFRGLKDNPGASGQMLKDGAGQED